MTDNLGSKHDNETNDPIFLISSLISIRYFILFFTFHDFKNLFSWGPPFGSKTHGM